MADRIGTAFIQRSFRPVPVALRDSQPQDDLAEDLIRLEPRLGGVDLVEREDRIDNWTHEVARDPGYDARGECCCRRDLFLDRPCAESRARDCDPFSKQEAQVEGRRRAGEQADEHQTALGCEHRQAIRQRRPSEQIDHDVDSPALGQRRDDVGKARMRRINDAIGSERLDSLELFRRARGTQDSAAGCVGNLDGGGADAAGGGVNQDALARCQADLSEECIVRGDESLGDCRGLHEIDVGRNRHRQPLVSHDVLGLAPTGDDAEDAISLLERTDDVRPQRVDFAGVFQPGSIGRSPRRCGIHPSALQQVGTVEPAGTHPDPHLIAPGIGSRDFANFENFRAACSGDHDGLHRSCLAGFQQWRRFVNERILEVLHGRVVTIQPVPSSGMARLMKPRGETEREFDPSPCPSLMEWRGVKDRAELAPGEIRVWLVDLDAGLSPADVELAEPGPELDVLAEDERSRATCGSSRHVTAGGLPVPSRCATIMGGLLRQPPRSIRLRAGGQGKPELDPEAPGANPAGARFALRFNVSHSSELALIAVCQGRELGVDIERVRAIKEADRIVASYFSPAEQAEFGTFTADAKALAFFRGWTRKEAILKGLGIGLAGLATQFETRFGTSEARRSLLDNAPFPRVDQWHLWEAAPRPGFVATLAVNAGSTADPAMSGPTTLGSVVASPGNDAVD